MVRDHLKRPTYCILHSACLYGGSLTVSPGQETWPVCEFSISFVCIHTVGLFDATNVHASCGRSLNIDQCVI